MRFDNILLRHHHESSQQLDNGKLILRNLWRFWLILAYRTDDNLPQWGSDILSKQQTGEINIKHNKCCSTHICNGHQFQASGIKCFASQTHNDSQLLPRFLSFFHYTDWVWLLLEQHHNSSFSYSRFASCSAVNRMQRENWKENLLFCHKFLFNFSLIFLPIIFPFSYYFSFFASYNITNIIDAIIIITIK